MISLIYARHRDVGEATSRYGGSQFTLHRQVQNIQTVPNGETGTIQYKGRPIPVCRRHGGHWETDPSTLGPIKITYLR